MGCVRARLLVRRQVRSAREHFRRLYEHSTQRLQAIEAKLAQSTRSGGTAQTAVRAAATALMARAAAGVAALLAQAASRVADSTARANAR